MHQHAVASRPARPFFRRHNQCSAVLATQKVRQELFPAGGERSIFHERVFRIIHQDYDRARTLLQVREYKALLFLPGGHLWRGRRRAALRQDVT
ncbi:MAG: hypothetical protein ACRDIV_05460 [Ktedonobacteraceae bacterium]